jgi:hypothetical protein
MEYREQIGYHERIIADLRTCIDCKFRIQEILNMILGKMLLTDSIKTIAIIFFIVVLPQNSFYLNVLVLYVFFI